jgi:hypothetical protein
MNFLDLDPNAVDLRPGLVLGMPEPPPAKRLEVSTDISCFLRVRWTPDELVYEGMPDEDDDTAVRRRFIKDLPGSPAGDYGTFRMIHHEISEWVEEVFVGEFRTRHPAGARMFFDNGGRLLHLVDLEFWVPPFDPSELSEDVDPELVAEERLEAALMFFYGEALERIDDYAAGDINQLALPDLWTRHVHLLPEIWARVAGFCRASGNRFFIADSAPPFRVLQDAERKRARAEGWELTEEELTVSALIPWYRPEKWEKREDVPVEAALTLDALETTRLVLRRDEITLSCIGVYWPWIINLKGMDLPPSSAICGVYARSDRENAPVGVMKPPANEPVKAVLDLAVHVDERPQNMLQREAVNLLQARVGKGIVVWGARTQCLEDIWRFVNVRRLIGYVGKQIQVDNQWAVFENNTGDLRATVARDVRYFLHDLWEKGALQGATPDEAFQVVCSGENNPDGVVERGILVVDVWVNPIQTNEFVHLQLTYGDALVE